MNMKIILIIILMALAVIFFIQNFEVINIRFLFWTLSISGSLLMFLLFLIGFALGWILHNYAIYNRKSKK